MAARDLLVGIEEGMAVLDSTGDRIGTVTEIYFGTASDEAEAYTTGIAPGPDGSGINPDIAENLVAHDIPDVVRRRLLTHGYLRIDTGFLQRDRFAFADHVVDVSDDGVRLSVSKNELVQ